MLHLRHCSFRGMICEVAKTLFSTNRQINSQLSKDKIVLEQPGALITGINQPI